MTAELVRRDSESAREQSRLGNDPKPQLGLAANWRQFALLVLINGFVGAMVGLERTALPLAAEREFGVASATAVLSFIAMFGLTKALTNLAAGWLVEQRGRRWTLIAGWCVAIPVPLLIYWAPSWPWIVAANALLGVSQGLTWSATVIMKIDLVGSKQRGLAMGLNEFAGYLAVAVAALVSGYAATRYGLRAGPAYLGVGIAVTGLLLSTLFAADTTAYARLEQSQLPSVGAPHFSLSQLLRKSLSPRSGGALFNVSQAGFVNNLNDGLAWGLFPIFFSAAGLTLSEIGVLVATYPAVWGLSQLWTGALSDRWGRKWLIVAGMVLQGVALVSLAVTRGFELWWIALASLGLGTALVYPTLLAAIGDVAQPSWRGMAVGVYRLWRDLGYVVGALSAGVLADIFGIPVAIVTVGLLTVASGLLVAGRLSETLNTRGA